MPDIRTGYTVHEIVLSLDSNNNPVNTATFSLSSYKDGSLFTGLTPSIILSDSSTGAFDLSFSASTIGTYQVYAKNNSTDVLFVSDVYVAKTDQEMDTNVYVGI